MGKQECDDDEDGIEDINDIEGSFGSEESAGGVSIRRHEQSIENIYTDETNSNNDKIVEDGGLLNSLLRRWRGSFPLLSRPHPSVDAVIHSSPSTGSEGDEMELQETW